MAATISIAIVANSARAVAGLKSTGTAAEQTQSKVSKMGGALKTALIAGGAIAAAALGKGMLYAVSAASDLAETVSKTQQVFGDASKGVLDFSDKAATALGQTKQQALDASATFGIFGKSAGLTGPKLAGFSTEFTTLASDLASFNNTSPQEAIDALGSAFRGEAEPMRKYGVLLDDATMRGAALKLGLIKTTKEALTPQNKVLAAQALIMEKTKLQQGDFARTSGGLANQQRIAKASMADMAATIGKALLPAAVKLVTLFNDRVMPVLKELWAVHGPNIIAWLATAGAKFDKWAASVSAEDVSKAFDKAKASIAEIVPALTDMGSGAAGDTFRLLGVFAKFAAQHIDLLVKALPYLVAGMAVARLATIGSNIAMAASPAFRIAEIIATRAHTKALQGQMAALVAATGATTGNTAAAAGNTAATAAGTGAQNTGVLARARATVAMVAQKVATVAVSAATKAAAAAQWLMNAAMTANPIGLIIAGIVLLVAGIVWLATKTRFFQTAWKLIWDKIGGTVKAVFGWLKTTFTNGIRNFVAIWGGLTAIVGKVLAFRDKVTGYIAGLIGKFGDIGRNIMGALRDGIVAGIQWVKDKVSGLGALIPDWLKSVLGISSPSKVMAKVGAQTIAGLQAGMQAQIPKVEKTIGGVAMAITGLSASPKVTLAGGATVTGGAAGAGNAYQINVTVAPGADPAEAGRQTVKAIEAWERRSGRKRLVAA